MSKGIPTTPESRENKLRATPLCDGVEASIIKDLALGAIELEFRPGLPLIEENTPQDLFYIVLSGHTQVVRNVGKYNPRRTYLAYIGPMDIAGEMRLLDDKPHTASVEALSRCTVIQLDFYTLRAKLKESARLSQNLAKVLAAKLVANGQQIELLRIENRRIRLLRILEFIATKLGNIVEDKYIVESSIGLHHLSAMIDTDEDQITKILDLLVERNLLRYEIKMAHIVRLEILDITALRQFDGNQIWE